MKLIVGLGNPEKKYDGTRHNVGFIVVDELAKELGAEFTKTIKKAVVAQGVYKGEKILIAKPQTYMNLSGESVRPLLDYYNIPISDLLVIVDDVYLEVGRLRIRSTGSDGGHNGLKNIIQHLGTKDFSRLRVGVGGAEGNLIGHVLGKFPKDEKKKLDEIVKICSEAALFFTQEGVEAAMNKYNAIGKEADDEPK